MGKSKLKWRNWPLGIKLTVAMTLLVIAAVGSVTLLAIRREQQAFRAELQQQADLLLATMAATAADPLYSLDTDALSDMVEALGAQGLGADRQILASGRVYDVNGRVVGDAYDPLAGFNLDPDPFGQRLVASDTTIFDWRTDQLIAGRAVTVGNQRLGAVSVGLPIAALQAKLATRRNQGVSVAVAAAVIGALLALLLSRSITGPLQGLITVTQRISEGDLTQEITTFSDDELAVLGVAMEQMRRELQGLYLSLEQQVAERTAELTVANEQLHQEIAARQRIEEELRQARDQALIASRLKTELLAKVSHELRTPLNAILGFAEMLQMGVYGPLSEEQQRPTVDIIDSTHYLTNLVNELLDQAKLDAGKLELNTIPFAPNDLVYPVKTQMRALAQAKGLNLTTEIADDLPQTLTGDLARLQQILNNLVSNAVKFTEVGSVKVKIYRPDSSHWSMQVTDTGLGIPQAAHAHIFKPFGQVDGSVTRRYRGTGLGLSIAKQLIELMGGDIKLESEIGQGSTFTVSLPMEKPYYNENTHK